MCRDSAGEGGEFKMDWTKRPALEVVASGLAVIFLERSKKRKSGNKTSFAKAKSWAERRCKLMAFNNEAKEKVILPLMKHQQDDARRIMAAKGKPIGGKFHCFLASAIA
eukprot:4392241-Prymnesium_polylepis.1